MSLFQQIRESEEKLRLLPLRAKIAVVVRCLLRVEPVASNLTEEQHQSLTKAIQALANYAKGANFDFPLEALEALQALEYSGVGTDSAYAVRDAAAAVTRLEKAKADLEGASKNLESQQELGAKLRMNIGWSTAFYGHQSTLQSAEKSYSEASGNLTLASRMLEKAQSAMDSLLINAIDHSILASASGAAFRGGVASRMAAEAALDSAIKDIEKAFLSKRSAILPEESDILGPLWLTYKPEFHVPTVVLNPFYSCFFSYSTADEEFANILHRDLVDNQVRCWFSATDLKIGARIRPSVHESIHEHDKLLLIMSQHSITSDWVADEVEMALRREREERRLVVFPVRIDDAVMQVKVGWPADIVNSRNIGDFCCWRDEMKYQSSLRRLLQDLKQEV